MKEEGYKIYLLHGQGKSQNITEVENIKEIKKERERIKEEGKAARKRDRHFNII